MHPGYFLHCLVISVFLCLWCLSLIFAGLNAPSERATVLGLGKRTLIPEVVTVTSGQQQPHFLMHLSEGWIGGPLHVQAQSSSGLFCGHSSSCSGQINIQERGKKGSYLDSWWGCCCLEQILSVAVGQCQRGRAEQREGAVRGSMWVGGWTRRETETSERRRESVCERSEREKHGRREGRAAIVALSHSAATDWRGCAACRRWCLSVKWHLPHS